MSSLLRELCPGFQKKRGLTHMSAIAAILKPLVRYLPPYPEVSGPEQAYRRLLAEILAEQNTAAVESESQGNEVVNFFRYLSHEFQNRVRSLAGPEEKEFSQRFGLLNFLTASDSSGKVVGFSFEVTHSALFTCFTTLAHERHVPFSIRSTKHLSERCKEKTLAVLREHGWGRSECPTRIVRGDRYYTWEWRSEVV